MSEPTELNPVCPYCDEVSELVGGDVIYKRRPDLAHKFFYRCELCDAWVGCHDGTDVPLGRLANAELRIAKTTAHAVFDPLWQAKMRRDGCSKTQARKAAYKWLAGQLDIPVKDCHIGMMDIPMIRRLVDICRAVRKPKEPVDA